MTSDESTPSTRRPNDDGLDRDNRDHAAAEPVVFDAIVAEPVQDGDATEPERPWYWKWVDNKPAVIGVLFGVTGALGLPLLFHSKAFSTGEKWLISVINIIYTAGLLYVGYLEVMKIIDLFQKAFAAV